jgi:NADPH:quinone reductase-like Zn-dependent oxidoreductase
MGTVSIDRAYSQPAADQILLFTEAAAAYRHLESGKAIGKVVLTV